MFLRLSIFRAYHTCLVCQIQNDVRSVFEPNQRTRSLKYEGYKLNRTIAR